MKTNKVSLSRLLLLLLPVWTVDAQKTPDVTLFKPDEEIVRLQNPKISAEKCQVNDFAVVCHRALGEIL